MEWYWEALIVVAVVWVVSGFIALVMAYQNQTQAKHSDSLGYDEIVFALLLGPIGTAIQVTAWNQNRT